MSNMIHHVAICQTCDWTVDARNAHGVGAQHATRYGHQVEVQIGYVCGVPREASS